MPVSYRMFSSSSFSVSGYTLKSLIHMKLMIIYLSKDRYSFNFSLFCVDYQFSHLSLFKMRSFLQYMLSLSLSNTTWLQLGKLLFGSSILFSLSTYLFLCQQQVGFSTISLQYVLKSDIVISPALFSAAVERQDSFGYLWSVEFLLFL